MPMTLKEFDDKYGAVVLNALAVYAEKMLQTAEKARADAVKIAQQPVPEPVLGTINVQPTVSGLLRSALMFIDCAERANTVHKAWMDETEGPDEDKA